MSSSISGVGASSGLPPGVTPLPGSSTSPMAGASNSASGVQAPGMTSGMQGSNQFGGLNGMQMPSSLTSMQAAGASSGATGTQATGSSGFQPFSTTSGTSGASGSSGTSNSSGTTSGSSGSSNALSASGEDTFLKLLVAQMQNQDPSSPMDTTSFVTELAQFNTVEQMINMQQTMQSALTAQQSTEGTVLLGRTVTYTVPSLDGPNPTVGQGQVTAVSLGSGGVQLQVNGQSIPLGQVTGVSP